MTTGNFIKEEEKADAVFAIAKNVAMVKYDDLPVDVVHITKKEILDIIGISLASSKAPEIKKLVELSKEMGGKGESTILVYGDRVLSFMAAFVNGVLSHGTNFGDTYELGISHPGSSVIPAALATAERVGKVSGRDFITAVALGADIVSRLTCAAAMGPMGLLPQPGKLGRVSSAIIWGYHGAAAAAGKLLGLNQDKLVDAFGVAYCQGNTCEEIFAPGAQTALYAGFINKTGVLSALMAQKGIPGAKNSIEGPRGLYNMFFNGEYDRTQLFSELGERFEGVNVSFKPWPSARCTHPYIEAALQIVHEHDIHPEEVEAVTLVVAEKNRNLWEPLEIRRAPRTASEAQLSIPFTVATAIAKRNVTLEDMMSEEGLKDPVVLQLAQKISTYLDTELRDRGIISGEVKIGAKKRVYSKSVAHAYGHPKRPMTDEDFTQKFRDCASYSIKPLAPDVIESVIEMVGHLEELDNISRIVDLVA